MSELIITMSLPRKGCASVGSQKMAKYARGFWLDSCNFPSCAVFLEWFYKLLILLDALLVKNKQNQ